MKIRAGHVSNSSSTSFCIYGYLIDNLSELSIEGDFDYLFDLEKKFRQNGINLEIVRGIDEYYDQYVIGQSPERMKMDQTRKEFTENIVDELKKVGISCDVDDIYFYVDGGRDS